MKTLLALLFAFLAGGDLPPRSAKTRLHVRPSGADLPVQCETFLGEVTEGKGYERSFGDGLVFRLRPTVHPSNPAGWTLEVREEGDGEHDFVWVATPPYRFVNPRDLTTSYGRSAREVVGWEVRSFGFVRGEEEHETLAEVVRFLLWRPRDMSEARYGAAVDSVRTRWEAMLEHVARGRLRITSADVTEPEPAHPPGRIERIAFTVTLCPSGHEPLGSLP